MLTVASYFILSGISGSFASAVGCAITGILFSIFLSIEGDSKWKNLTFLQKPSN